MKITTDREACMGSGNCSFHAPHTFDIDDDMKVVVLDPHGDPDEDILNAVDGCPVKAITAVPEGAGAGDAAGDAAVDQVGGRSGERAGNPAGDAVDGRHGGRRDGGGA